MSPKVKAWVVDAGERVAVAFGVAFVGSLVSSDFDLSHLSTAKAATNAGIGAGLAVLYSLLAALRSGTISPASMLPAQQPGQAQQDAPPPVDESPVQTTTLARLDPRLGRHVEHDERSRNFPARTAPVVKTTRHRHYGRVLDQGQLGSCTGNALIDCLMTAPLHKTGRVLTEGDAVKVYELATTLDSIPGAYPPSDTGSSGLAACKAAQRLGLISGYRHAFGVDECLAALTLGPVMIGIPWYESMFNPAADGTLTVSGKVAGGHEVALIGVDARKRTVTLLNSWGSGWGLNGRAYLSWADLDRLLSEQGDCTVPEP